MYLKRIETLGFKSFASKTIINFNDGITGVVGPNGSGKSNIVDAVRWVLGEQSIKSLRGGTTMNDVIFSGSKTRSAHNYAYVTLVLDNSDNYLQLDYDEIEITRKVYRSGESEYLLNKTKCRLKDVSDLILDSGVGKESFSIISQDAVQSLLNSKPEERRYIFDEAAGVLKYRKRKEATLKKLLSADENLNRVNDIVVELERQVAPLKVQSDNAKVYLEISKQLKDIEIALLAHEIHYLNDEYQSLNEAITQVNTNLVTMFNDEQQQEQQLNELKKDIKQLDKLIESNNDLYIAKIRSLDELNNNQKLIEERIKYNSEDPSVILNKQRLHTDELDLIKKINKVSEEIAKHEYKYNSSNERHVNLQTAYDSLVASKTELVEDYNKKEAQLISVQTKLKNYENNNQNNLFSGVNAVLNNPTLTGIVDIVSNLIDVDKQYATAIDYALGNSSQFVIVNSKDDASNAIAYLNEHKRGRVTFLPLDLITKENSTYDFSKHPNIYGFANDLVSYDEKYAVVINNLIGNIVLAKDLKAATDFFKICNKFKVITLSGEVIHPKGSITGGNSKHKKSIFGARADYESNKLTVAKLEKELDKTLVRKETLNKEISDAEHELYLTRVELMQMQEVINVKNNTIEQYNITLNSIKTELASIEINDDNNQIIEDNIKEIKVLQEELSKITIDLDKLKLEKVKKNSLLDEYETAFKALGKLIKEQKAALNKEEIKVNRLEVNLDNYITRLTEEYQITFERAFEEYHLDYEVAEAKTLVKNYKNKIAHLGPININAIEEYEEIKVRYDFLSEQKADIVNAKTDLMTTIEELDTIMIEQFSETFTAVSQEFAKMFKSLFGGGNAKLSLSDETDLLNTGIEIVAQPPGKKLQHLSLLSGGEKSLSTLVLLFAILKIRPVPFCILDEVEAALDDANLVRFAHFLKQFSKTIQFIIITHRKVTMENANVLYGITMQESGVSKLVSVQLSEANKLTDEV